MAIALLIILALIICFGGVLLFGAPYLPSLSAQIETALDLANLKEGETILELGCGDGKVLIAAAKRGLRPIGYELNPILFIISWLRTRRYGKQVKVILGDFWRIEWPEADAIFVFLLDKYMDKLNKKCIQSPYKPFKLVSFAFSIPTLKPEKFTNGVYLYQYK